MTGGFPHKGPVRQKCFRSVTSMMICVASSDDKDDLIHKPHNAPVSYPITHTFVTEIFLCFRCPCTYPPRTHPHPSPSPSPPHSRPKCIPCLYPISQKRSIFNGRREFVKSRKKGSFFRLKSTKRLKFACVYFYFFVPRLNCYA